MIKYDHLECPSGGYHARPLMQATFSLRRSSQTLEALIQHPLDHALCDTKRARTEALINPKNAFLRSSLTICLIIYRNPHHPTLHLHGPISTRTIPPGKFSYPIAIVTMLWIAFISSILPPREQPGQLTNSQLHAASLHLIMPSSKLPWVVIVSPIGSPPSFIISKDSEKCKLCCAYKPQHSLCQEHVKWSPPSGNMLQYAPDHWMLKTIMVSSAKLYLMHSTLMTCIMVKNGGPSVTPTSQWPTNPKR